MLYRNIYIGFGVCLVHLCDQQMSKINIIYNFIGRVIKIKKKIKQNKKMSYLVIIPILAPEKINKLESKHAISFNLFQALNIIRT